MTKKVRADTDEAAVIHKHLATACSEIKKAMTRCALEGSSFPTEWRILFSLRDELLNVRDSVAAKRQETACPASK
jgi:hypothetical protein